MKPRHLLALCGAITAFVAVSPADALAAPPVTVRVEGATKTLLAPTVVKTHGGYITKGGTPGHACSARTAAGALDVATNHRWNGNWDSKYGTLLLTSFFNETHTLKSSYYWSIWVDNRYASSGICGLQLHRGEQLLFAAVPDTFSGHPTALAAPAAALVNQSFTVKVESFTAAGKRMALAGATVRGRGISAKTDSHGVARILAGHAGVLVLQADESGYIRTAPVRVHVSK